MSTVVSLRLNDEEEAIVKEAASVYPSISSMIKGILFEYLEDQYDLKIIEEFEKREAAGEVEYVSHEELWKALNDEDI